MLQLKLCGVAAIVVSSPYWLYQIWALHRARACTPTSGSGRGSSPPSPGRCSSSACCTGYYVLPKGLEVLIGFTPARLQNLVEFGEYFSFLTRMLLVFGIAFEIPLFVIMLNLAGVVSGQAAGALPAVDHPRHVRLRRGRDAVDRPVLDADAGAADAGAVRSSPRSIARSVDRRRGRRPDGTDSGPTTSSRRCDARCHARRRCDDLDPFDLPDWLGDVRGHLDARAGLRTGHPCAAR